MVAPEMKQSFVAIVLGNESDLKVMQHTIDVLNRLQVPYETVLLQGQDGAPDVLAYLQEAGCRGMGMVVVGTYYAYTNELFPTDMAEPVPVVKVITGPVPRADAQVALDIATMGIGADGATNAGLFAARVLARTDPALAARLRSSLPLP